MKKRILKRVLGVIVLSQIIPIVFAIGYYTECKSLADGYLEGAKMLSCALLPIGLIGIGIYLLVD